MTGKLSIGWIAVGLGFALGSAIVYSAEPSPSAAGGSANSEDEDEPAAQASGVPSPSPNAEPTPTPTSEPSPEPSPGASPSGLPTYGPSPSPTPTPKERHFHVALGAMYLSNSSQQGGPGPSGTTVLTEFDAMYHYKFVGGGLFGQFDFQGSNETDIAFGPRLELTWRLFHIEGGWAPFQTRNFSDRSIAKQTGSMFFVGAGVRVPVYIDFIKLAPGEKSAFFLHFSYKYRIQILTSQDSTPLSDSIIQRDMYPIAGLGYLF